MALQDVLARGRAAAEARMLSRITVRRLTGRQAQDEDNGTEAPEWETVHADVPIRLDFGSSSDGGSRGVQVGGVHYEQATAVGHLPIDTAGLRDGDYFEITAGAWAGAAYSIVKAVQADQKTARRLPIREESRPEEWGS